MENSKSVTVPYTKEIVSDAVRTFVWRRGVVDQKGLWAAELAVIVLLLMLLWNGERGWTVGVIGVVILLPPCLIIAMWIAHYRNSVGKFLNMSTHRADFVLSDQKFGIISDLGEAKLPWATITEVWEKPEYWMLFTSPNQFMTLPMLTFSSADREFLRSKLISAMYRA